MVLCSGSSRTASVEEDEEIYLMYYFHESKKFPSEKNSSVLLQLSIGITLLTCPKEIVDELEADETVCSFSKKWPEYANSATKVYNIINDSLI